MRSHGHKKFLEKIPLFFIILVGSIFRFYNLDWDQGNFFHPDERNIAVAVSRISFFDQLDPKFYAYGSLPIYLYRLAGEILAANQNNPTWLNEWSKINLIGRSFSAFFSSLTILLVYFLAKNTFKKKQTALLSALFVAFSPSLIQVAHYGVTESLLVLWVVSLTLASVYLVTKPSLKNHLLSGGLLGLSAATKFSALSFISPLLSSHFLTHFSPPYQKATLKKRFSHLSKLFLLFFIALLTYSFLSPYTYLSWLKFKESIEYEGGVVNGRLKVVYVLQFENTPAYVYQVKNLLWQMGPVTAVGLAGIFLLLIWSLKKKNSKALVFLSFPIVYFLYVGSWYTKFIRYMVPVLPFLGITAAWFLTKAYERRHAFGAFLIALFGLTSFFWSLAFFSIYTRESTRIIASKWIYRNIPQNAKILTEHWDDGLPIPIPPQHPDQYQVEPLTIYEEDNQAKVKYYANKLTDSDYVIISSRRLYGTLIDLPDKYPVTSYYYQKLFNQQLGYKKVAEFSSYPAFLGLTVNDDTSEETFQVYDHPKVMVFKNTEHLNEKEITDILMPALPIKKEPAG